MEDMAKEVPEDMVDPEVLVATAMTDVVVVVAVEVGAVAGSSVASSMGTEEVITEEALRMFVMEDSRGMAATTI